MKNLIAVLSAGAIAAALTALAPAVAASAALTSSAVPAASSRVVISGIYYNSPGSDTGSNSSLNAEWVRLHNVSDEAVTLTGWTLRDAAGHVFTFRAYKLRAHGYVKIHTGHGRRTRANRYWDRSWYIWNNTGDKATLRTSSGAYRARCKYSDPHEDASYTGC